MTPVHQLWVPGTPRPQGSTRSFNHSRTGNIITLHSNAAQLTTWRNRVTLATRQYLARYPAYRVPSGPVSIILDFALARPKSHSKARAATDHDYHYVRPDLDKLTRAVLDALDAADLYTDDSQVTSLATSKSYAADEDPGVLIRWMPLVSPWAVSRGGW